MEKQQLLPEETFKKLSVQNFAEYQIEKMLDAAFDELFSGKRILERAEKLFLKKTEIKETNLRPDIDFPYGLSYARRVFETGYKYLRELAKIQPADRNSNQFARAIYFAKIISARISAESAIAYVEYWKNCMAYDNFGVLGFQANAYAHLVTRNNWDFLVPLILLKPEEPLFAKTAKDAERIFEYAQASMAYALCLEAQVRTLAVSEKPVFPTIIEEVDDAPLNVNDFLDKKPIALVDLPKIAEDLLKLDSQKAIREAHAAYIGNEIKESICARREVQALQPKRRLVGFDSARGGKAHRRNTTRG